MPAEPGALPAHQRIAEALIRDIAAGRLLDGERLPTERTMAADFGVAVGTLRKALATLAQNGLLERVQGSGNYVRAKAGAESVYALFRLELIRGGGLPTARILSVDRLPKDPGLPRFGQSDAGWRIRRLRSLSGAPAALEEIWLDAACAPDLRAADLSESLYLYYRQRLNIWIARAEDSIGLAPAPDWSPAAFPPAPGAPLPHITRLSWDQNGAAIEASWTWVDPATARYVARLR